MEKNMDTKNDFGKTEKFDFGMVGKRMPYSIPDDFFTEMEANILEQVKDDKPKPVRIQPKKRPLMKVICGSTPGTQHRFRSASFFSAISGR